MISNTDIEKKQRQADRHNREATEKKTKKTLQLTITRLHT